MKTRITFLMNDKQETEICTVYDAPFIPFKKGDKFWFYMEMLYPVTVNRWRTERWKDDFIEKRQVDHEQKSNQLLGRYKIVKVCNSLTYDINSKTDDGSHRCVIEYTCKPVKTIYWKFWQTYKFKKMFGLIKY